MTGVLQQGRDLQEHVETQPKADGGDQGGLPGGGDACAEASATGGLVAELHVSGLRESLGGGEKDSRRDTGSTCLRDQGLRKPPGRKVCQERDRGPKRQGKGRLRPTVSWPQQRAVTAHAGRPHGAVWQQAHWSHLRLGGSKEVRPQHCVMSGREGR